MLISDELTKLDMEAEQIAKKMSRKYGDFAGEDAKRLTVGGLNPRKYWETFQWNVASYPCNRKLGQIVKIIQNHIKTSNANFSNGMTLFQDARNKLAAAERRAGGNLLVGDLDDILAELGRDPKEMFRETEFKKCVLVVVATSEEKEFLETYDQIDKTAITVFKETKNEFESPCTDIPMNAPIREYRVITESGRVIVTKLGTPNTKSKSPTVWQIKSAIAKQHNFEYAFIQLFANDRVLGDLETLNSAGVKLETDDDDDEPSLKLVFESPSLNRNRIADKHLSPVVPGSAELLTKDSDGYSMYSIHVVRGRDDQFLESFKTSCQKMRYTVREYDLAARLKKNQPTKSLKKIIRELQSNERDAKLDLLKRCPAYFNTVYTALAHIKAIRVFAESVLRYGVPANFISVVVDYSGSSRVQIRAEKALGELYAGLDILGISKLDTSGKDKTNQAEQNLLDKSQQRFYPYVYIGVDCMERD